MPIQIRGWINLKGLEKSQIFCTCLMSPESWFKHQTQCITRERRLSFQPRLHPETGSLFICFRPSRTLLSSKQTLVVSPFNILICNYQILNRDELATTRTFIQTCLPGLSDIALPLRTYAHRAGQSPKKKDAKEIFPMLVRARWSSTTASRRALIIYGNHKFDSLRTIAIVHPIGN